MSDETDISEEKKWLGEERARIAVARLSKNKMNACYVSGRQEAVTAILEMIPEGATIGRGDSITIDQVGVISALAKRGQRVIFPIERHADGSLVFDTEQRQKMYAEIFSCDVFLTGTNAVTLDGKLVNVDGYGSRVAPMIFGPKRVIVVAGVNKIVKDVDEALARIREYAAPMNAKRHYMKGHGSAYGELPCVRTGRCVDCRHDSRICNITVILSGAMLPVRGRINMVLVGEELGI